MMRAAWTLAAAVATTTTTTTTSLLLARSIGARAMATTTTSASTKLPTLKGIVFDMDDTLVRSNLDIRAMYKKVFGTDPSPDGFDILKDIADIDDPSGRDRAFEIIAGIEAESRKKMALMPGCAELLTWLAAHEIPKALVTRNNRATTDVFCEMLREVSSSSAGTPGAPGVATFGRIVTRDDTTAGGDRPIPPKPDPTAMNIIASECFGVILDDAENSGCPGILMVGDSVSNDVVFGKNAGVSTALLVTSDRNLAGDAATGEDVTTDMVVTDLTDLPRTLWNAFEIDGPLGNTPGANALPLHGSPPPVPESRIAKLVVEQENSGAMSLDDFSRVLGELSAEELLEKDATNGNTALVWAAETGKAGVAGLLLDAVAAKVSEEELAAFVNHRGYLGATAVTRAARRGHTAVLRTLRGHPSGVSFDVDVPNDKLQHPLHFAAFKKNPEALEYLLTEMDANPWVLDRKGRTPLQDTSCPTCQSILRTAMEGSNRN